MSGTRRKFDKQFKLMAVELSKTKDDMPALAKELDIRTELLYRWRKELNLHTKPDGSTKYSNDPDFKFVVIHKFLSVENEFAVKDGLLLDAYFLLKSLGLSDVKAFGLDKSNVVIEQIPLVYHPIYNLSIERVQ